MQDDARPRSIDRSGRPRDLTNIDHSHNDLTDSLNRLSLVNATATPLPASPALLSPRDPASRSPVPYQRTPRRSPSSNSLRDERRKSTPVKSTPVLQKRTSTASLRSVSNHTGPSSPLFDSRRSSANLAGSPTTAASPAMLPPRLLPQGPTAASIAAEHFQKEVDLHQMEDLQSKTVVIVHDACYGHRFSRPRTTRNHLAAIVERPERMRACVVGIAAAYVRLGRRHAGGPYAPHPHLDILSLPPPFQIRKTGRTLLLSDNAVANVHGTQWMSDLNSMCDVAESRLALTGKELVRPPAAGGDGASGQKPPPSLHEGDLYLCSESLNAFQGALGGVCDGIDTVLGPGPTTRAFVCIRPPGHHCSSDFPSGFCWINNVHVGISYAATHHGLTHAAILDFDLHHGDGSQEIAFDHNHKALTPSRNQSAYEKTAIGYYSLHDINSYPCEDGNPEKVRNASVCVDGAHNQSIWNVHLQTWVTEGEFWNLYETQYMTLIHKARAFLRAHTQRLSEIPYGPPPKAAIFISAGFDASEWEGSGMQRHKVNVPTEFYARFTADVVRMSEEEGLGVDGRVISVLEGGYSDRALSSGVLSHISGLGSATHGLQSEYVKSERASEDVLSALDQLSVQEGYDKEWWSPSMLSELEMLNLPPAKDEREKGYWKDTRSFSAKKVSNPRKSFGSSTAIEPHQLPPLPEVGWATAAHELSKVLIPENRQTTSYRAEELNAEASRQRRDRQIALDGGVNPAIVPPPPPAPIDEKRQLRVRKTKSPTPYSPRPATPRQQAMRKNRRTTIDGNDLPSPSGESPSADASRRKSVSGVAPIEIGNLGSSANPTRRASSAASMKSATGTVTGLRKSNSTRPATPKRSTSPRKAPPVPKVPTAFLPSKLSDEVPPSDDVENLTSGLRKIKLVMPSPEEQAAREKKAAEESKLSRGSRTPKSPRSPRKSSSTRTARGRGARIEPSSSMSPPPLPVPTIGLGMQENIITTSAAVVSVGAVGAGAVGVGPVSVGESRPLPARAISSPWEGAKMETETSITDPICPASKPTEVLTPSMRPTSMPATEPNSIPAGIPSPHTPESTMIPPGSSGRKSVSHARSISHGRSVSNTFSPATTTAAQTKQGLPVFTSTSPIPFATEFSQNPNPNQLQQQAAHNANAKAKAQAQAQALQTSHPHHDPNQHILSDEDSPLGPPPVPYNFQQNRRFYSQ